MFGTDWSESLYDPHPFYCLTLKLHLLQRNIIFEDWMTDEHSVTPGRDSDTRVVEFYAGIG